MAAFVPVTSSWLRAEGGGGREEEEELKGEKGRRMGRGAHPIDST